MGGKKGGGGGEWVGEMEFAAHVLVHEGEQIVLLEALDEVGDGRARPGGNGRAGRGAGGGVRGRDWIVLAAGNVLEIWPFSALALGFDAVSYLRSQYCVYDPF